MCSKSYDLIDSSHGTEDIDYLDSETLTSILCEAFLNTKIDINQISSIAEAVSISINETRSIIAPLVRFATKFSEAIQTNSNISQKLRVLGIVTKKLGEQQFVLWESLGDKELKQAYELDADVFIEIHMSNRGYFEDIIQSLNYEPLLMPMLALYKQCIDAYISKNYNLAVVGLTSIIDGLLAKTSLSNNTEFQTRCEALLKCFNEDVYYVEQVKYEAVTLIYSFWLAISSFSKTRKFGTEEPPLMNRHWIMHGRTIKNYTRTDCLKLINIIYSIIFISGSTLS